MAFLAIAPIGTGALMGRAPMDSLFRLDDSLELDHIFPTSESFFSFPLRPILLEAGRPTTYRVLAPYVHPAAIRSQGAAICRHPAGFCRSGAGFCRSGAGFCSHPALLGVHQDPARFCPDRLEVHGIANRIHFSKEYQVSSGRCQGKKDFHHKGTKDTKKEEGRCTKEGKKDLHSRHKGQALDQRERAIFQPAAAGRR